MILDTIIDAKRIEVKEKKRQRSIASLKAMLRDVEKPRDFTAQLKDPKGISLIAEIKRASPSAGVIREDFDPVEIAKAYERGGASAISVLTDSDFFGGKLEFLGQVREATSVPILRKDFIIDEYQIYESRLNGADAILLIAAALELDQLIKFTELSRSCGMASLVEVHTREELEKVLKTDAMLIGINNRDLKTFKVDLNTTIELLPMIPKGKVIVSESGIKGTEDVRLLERCGVDAILVGESLMRSRDIEEKVKELIG